MKYFTVPVPSMMLETQLSHINGNPIYEMFSDKNVFRKIVKSHATFYLVNKGNVLRNEM